MNKKVRVAIIAAGAALLLLVICILAVTLDRNANQQSTEPSDGGTSTSDVTTEPGGEGVEDWEEPSDDTTEPIASQPTAPSEDGDSDIGTEPSQGDDDSTPPETKPTTSTEPSVEPTRPTVSDPTEPTPPSESTEPSEPTEPEEPTEPTEPSEPQPTTPPEKDLSEFTYEDYEAMTPQERQAFMGRFESINAFWDWYDAAKAAYDATRETIEVGGDGGGIDLGDLIGGNG